jgi:hypothetical protein
VLVVASLGVVAAEEEAVVAVDDAQERLRRDEARGECARVGECGG